MVSSQGPEDLDPERPNHQQEIIDLVIPIGFSTKRKREVSSTGGKG